MRTFILVKVLDHYAVVRPKDLKIILRKDLFEIMPKLVQLGNWDEAMEEYTTPIRVVLDGAWAPSDEKIQGILGSLEGGYVFEWCGLVTSILAYHDIDVDEFEGRPITGRLVTKARAAVFAKLGQPRLTYNN
jgi:hypothetical protein